MQSPKHKVGTTALTPVCTSCCSMPPCLSPHRATRPCSPSCPQSVGRSAWPIFGSRSPIPGRPYCGFFGAVLGGEERSPGRKVLTVMGVSGFIISTLLCGRCIFLGLSGDRRRADIRPVRDFPGDLRRLRKRDAFGDTGLSRFQDPAERPGRGPVGTIVSFSLGTIIGPAVAPFSCCLSVGLAGPLFAFAVIALGVFPSILLWLPDDRSARQGRARCGDELSLPRLAADGCKRRGRDVAAPPHSVELERSPDRAWILAGVAAGHAQAAA